MTRRTKISLGLAGIGLAALILVLALSPMCACTPALKPAEPPSELIVALDTLARREEAHYRLHAQYTDALDRLGLDSVFASWNPRMPIANDRGFDLLVRLDSVSCSYVVRRVTDDTTVIRRVHCAGAS